MTMQACWSVRLYKEGDDESLNRLFNEVFGKDRGLEQWKWKFLENPAAPEKIIPVGIINNRIVGMYPSVLNKWKLGPRLGLVAQVVENAITKSARDGRLIVALHRAHLAECDALGIAFAFGLPNESHYKVTKRLLGYRDLLQLPILHKRLNSRLGPLWPVYRWINRLKYTWSCKLRNWRGTADVITRPVNQFDDRFDRLWKHASKAYQILAIRDSQFLEWRYGRNPRKDYACIAADKHDELVGYLILKFMSTRSGKVAIIADVFSLPDRSVVDTLIHHAILWCLKEAVVYLRCGALAHTELYHALRRAGFRVRRRVKNVVYLPYDGVSDRIFQDSTQWYLTLGDFDFDE